MQKAGNVEPKRNKDDNSMQKLDSEQENNANSMQNSDVLNSGAASNEDNGSSDSDDSSHSSSPDNMQNQSTPPVRGKAKTGNVKHVLFKTYHCPGENCKVTKQTKKALVKHILDEHDGYQYKCRMCDKGYLSLIGCYKHEKHHTMGKCYKCDECGKNFQFEGELNEHYRKHTGDDLWFCEKDKTCDKAYPPKRARNLHHKSHTDSQDYHCDIVLKDGTTCDQVCVSPDHLKKHK